MKEEVLNVLSETEQVRLQWIKGEKIGTVEVVKSQDSDWVNFESGGRISVSLVPEFMYTIEGEPLVFDDNSEVAKLENKLITKRNGKSSILILLEKMTSYSEEEFCAYATIKLPKVATLEILRDSFGEDNVNIALTEFIKSQLSTDSIIKELNKQIDTFTSKLK